MTIPQGGAFTAFEAATGGTGTGAAYKNSINSKDHGYIA